MKKIIVLFLLLLTVISVHSIFVSANNNDLFLQGVKEYYQGSYQKAIETLDKVLDNDNNNLDALYYQTLALIEEYKVSRVKTNIDKMAGFGYRSGKIHWKLGRIYLNEEGKFDSPFYNEAKNELEKARELGIDTPTFHRDLAKAYQGLGNLEKAAVEYKKALNTAGQPEDYINLTLIYKDMNQIDKAIETGMKAVEYNPDNVSVYMILGELYLEDKQYNNAVKILNVAVEKKPQFAALRAKLAMAYYQGESYDNAGDEFKNVIKLNKNYYQGYYYLGEISRIKGNFSKAISYYQQAVKYNPDYVKAYIGYGQVYLKQNQPYQAISQFTSAIEKNTEYPESHYYLGLAYYDLDMKEAAEAEFRRAVHLDNEYMEAKEMLKKVTME